MFISIDQLNESEERFSGSPEQKIVAINDGATIFNVGEQRPATANILNADENLTKRKEMLETVQQEPVDFALERAIGENDSVYSNFVELIRACKQKVGRIAIKTGNENMGFATGFMVSERLMMTNWHVFKTIDDVGDSEIQFNYEYNTQGNPQAPVMFKLDCQEFYHANRQLDYCLVAVNPVDVTGEKNLADIGYLFLDPALGKLGHEGQEALNIIHHPNGDYMQLSIRENLFKEITPTSIWYETDTAPGSSGSPVFNDQWQVVALHHMGVAKKNAAGQYIDKQGEPIPVINGKIDEDRVVWEANEGIRTSVILNDLFTEFPDHALVDGLKTEPGEKKGFAEKRQLPQQPAANIPSPNIHINPPHMEPGNTPNNVSINFPASLVETNGTININISLGTPQNTVPLPTPAVVSAPAADENPEFVEIKKLESSIDFSSCKGYLPNFLGNKNIIAFPEPQKSLRKFIAKVGNGNDTILKYHHYSTLFHSVRMMPAISGINVDGDPEKRKDDSVRKDTWLRDSRLSFDIQLDDKYYRNSGFDKGHMSRREDANWGTSAEEAKRNADLTCMYTNACPQVAKLNQSSKKGLWGILEKVILEDGVKDEKKKTSKISVFNGPICKDSDPVFRGIQIPMDFFKIVLWLTDEGNLKATAFKLSQVDLVGDIDFEQLDLDQNPDFKEYQCSIASLQAETQIDFSEMAKYDTFEGDGTTMEISSAKQVGDHIRKHRNDKAPA